MEFWSTFWLILLFGGLGLFACLALAVSIGGFYNIRSLFRELANQTERRDESSHDTEDEESHTNYSE